MMRVGVAIVVAAIIALMVSCTLSTGARNAAGNSTGDMQMNKDIAGEELLDKTFDEVLELLGPPAKQEQFALGPHVMEFRVGLKNFFDEARLKSDPPDIREATWLLSSESNLTLWFTRREEDWRVLHHLSWHPDDLF